MSLRALVLAVALVAAAGRSGLGEGAPLNDAEHAQRVQQTLLDAGMGKPGPKPNSDSGACEGGVRLGALAI